MTAQHAYLFDIDNTLMAPGPAAFQAMSAAVRETFRIPEHLPLHLDTRPATDAAMFREFLQRRGWQDLACMEADLFRRYHKTLERYLSLSGEPRLLPGVEDLLSELSSDPSNVLAVVCGDTRESAFMKLRRVGLDRFFNQDLGAYGSDHHDRQALGPVALGRITAATGIEIRGANARVFGDTPTDMRCARAIGATAVGVGTGRFSRGELRSYGAHYSFHDLGDVGMVLDAIGAATACVCAA